MPAQVGEVIRVCHLVADHPQRHAVTSGVLGEPGCVSYHVKPRLGIIGMLAGWWHVKVSSGCPRSAAHARTF